MIPSEPLIPLAVNAPTPSSGLLQQLRTTWMDPDESLKPLTLDASRVNFLGL